MDNDMNKKTDNRLRETIVQLRAANVLYVMHSACTKEPYVRCDEETFDDEILLFIDFEAAKKQLSDMLKEKILVNVARVEKKQLLGFYTNLYTMGVNAIYLPEKDIRIQLSQFVKRLGTEGEGEKKWIENPALHLTMLYYMQETRGKKGQENREDLRQMQEEITRDILQGSLIMAVQQEGNGLPLIKVKEGELFQPIFTDIIQFQKFNKEGKLKPLAVVKGKLINVLSPQAKGIVLNPMGVNMMLTVTRKKAAEGSVGGPQTPTPQVQP